MPDVILRYDAKGFGPIEKKVAVKKGDTITFCLHEDTLTAVKGARLRITMDNPECFDKSSVEHKEGQSGSVKLKVKVKEVPTGSFYTCEMLDAKGNSLKKSSGKSGGEIVPDTGGKG
jgi:hypothetical protein